MHASYRALHTRSESDRSPSEASQESESLTCKHPEDFTSKVIGDFGPWQRDISILMTMLKFPHAWYQLGILFLAPAQDFWCEKPEEFAKYTLQEWRDMCKPRTEEHPCLIFDPQMLITARSVDKQYIPLIECPRFVYDNTTFRSTIMSEWDLVCNKKYLVQLSQVVLMWGILVGNISFGSIGDKYGRRKPLLIGIVLQSFFSIMSALSPSYWIFLSCRFLLAVASGGVSIISFVVCMEVVSGKYRTIIPIVYQIPFGFGNAIMSLIAYYLRAWRPFELTLGSLSGLYVLYVLCVPESPRWLIAMGRNEEAIVILKKAAKRNGMPTEISPETMRLLHTKKPDPDSVPGFFTFFKYKNMRLKTILLCVNWFFLGIAFYTLSQYMGQVTENPFLTVALGGIISSPGTFLCIFIVKRWGRKLALIGSQMFTATCSLLLLSVPKDSISSDWPRMLIAGFGLGGMAMSFPALYLFTGELYPTLGRNVGVGGCSMMSRIGSMLSPVLISLDRIAPAAPVLAVVVFSASQALLVCPLPETKGCPLPATIEEAEMFNKSYSTKYRRQIRKNKLKKISETSLQ